MSSILEPCECALAFVSRAQAEAIGERWGKWDAVALLRNLRAQKPEARQTQVRPSLACCSNIVEHMAYTASLLHRAMSLDIIGKASRFLATNGDSRLVRATPRGQQMTAHSSRCCRVFVLCGRSGQVSGEWSLSHAMAVMHVACSRWQVDCSIVRGGVQGCDL